MPKPIRTKKVMASQVSSYLSKAKEFLSAAESELAAGRTIAATSLAIHSAINAADVVCGVRLGERAKGGDHSQVVKLLRQAGRDGEKVAKELKRLLPLKTKSEYEPDEIALPVAARAIERASRCVLTARAVASSAN